MRNGKFVGNVKKAASESRYQKNVCLLGRGGSTVMHRAVNQRHSICQQQQAAQTRKERRSVGCCR